MNTALKDWTRGIIESTWNCIERMKNHTLSEKDRTSHSIMLVELAQAIRSDTEYTSDPAMQDIAGRLLDSFSALTNDNVDILELKNDEIRQLTTFGEILVSEEDKRRFKAREDGRTYIDFLPLMPREQYMQTVENLKNMGAKYDAETKQWYVEKDWQPEMSRSENALEKQKSYKLSSGKDVTPIELTLPYMSQETFKTARTEIKAMGAKFNADKKVWYIERSAGEDTINQIKDCLDRHDEGIYLKLPKNTTKEQFKMMVGQLKENGARYNPGKKAWYITNETDQSKFAEYLPSKRLSVREKLFQKQENAAKNDGQKEKTIEPRNKDTHDRV